MMKLLPLLFAVFLLGSCSCSSSSEDSEDTNGSNSPDSLVDSMTDPLSGKVIDTNLAAPSGLTFLSATDTTITFSWSDNSDSETGFVIEARSNGSTDWFQAGTAASNAVQGAATGLAVDSPYELRVRAETADRVSEASDALPASTEISVPQFALTRGVQSRPCGMDTNGDGTIEESECHYCDGVTTDPDGDSQDEDIFYVASDGGVDNVTCGSALTPCATITYTLNNRVNGVGGSEEDIICIAGTFNESLTLTQSGKASALTLYDEGVSVSIEPFTIMGWDTDNDGQYPPYDSDDEAVLDGSIGPLEVAVDLGANNTSYVRLAHLTVRGYRENGGNVRLFNLHSAAPKTSAWFHDLSVEDIASGLSLGSDFNAIFFLSDYGNIFTDLVVENVNVESGIPLLVGNINTVNNWPVQRLLVNNVSMQLNSAAAASPPFFHGRGLLDLVIKNSHFDSRIEDWNGSYVNFVSLGHCNRNWTIKDNIIIDVGHVLMNWFTGNCGTNQRTVDNIHLLRNHFTVKSPGLPATAAISIQNPIWDGGLDAPTNVAEDYIIAGNAFHIVNEDADYCLRSGAGNSGGTFGGQVVFVGNTCVGADEGMVKIQGPGSDNQDNVVIYNNYFQATDLVSVIFTNFDAGGNLLVDYNVYAQEAPFDWHTGGTEADFAAWQLESGQDANSTICAATLETVVAPDYYLPQPTDSCLNGVGTDITTWLPIDYKGDAVSPTGSAGWHQ